MPYERTSQYPYQRSGTEIAMTPGMQWLDPLVTLSMIAGQPARSAWHERVRPSIPRSVTLASESLRSTC